MKLPWLIKKTEPTPEPVPASEPAKEPPFDPGAEQTEQAKRLRPVPAPAGFGEIDPTRITAGVVTVASAAFTAWSVWDLMRGPAPDALALVTGVGVEAVWLFLLSIEWRQATRTGRVHHLLTWTGWGLAAGAAAVLALHGVMTFWPMVALAALPLAAKAGWHWLTRLRAEETLTRLEAESAAARKREEADRRAAEEERLRREKAERRQRELSDALTEEQEAELAALRRDAAYVRAKTEAELELERAKAQADQERALAEIRRRAEQQMTVDEAAAEIEVRRHELSHRIRLASPVYTATELPAARSPRVPDDLSGMDATTGAGGMGFTASRPAQPAQQDDGPARLLAWMRTRLEAGARVSVRGAAADLDVAPRTVRRWRDALEERGHDVEALYPKGE